MRHVFVALAVVIAVSGTAYARPEWSDPVKGITLTCGFLDPHYIRTPCRSNGRLDPEKTWRQHLGSDFRAPAGATVFAPVTGTIVLFDAAPGKAADLAYLVIRDAQTNEEHVIGHISSNLRLGAKVAKGKPIGQVRDQGSNTHVHWGFNLGSVERAARHVTRCKRDGRLQNCKWGWGKAPYEATEREVRAQGWRNVL